MPDILTVSVLSVDNRHLADGFNCGEQPWSRAIEEWVTSDLWLEKRSTRGTITYLYFNSMDEFVGFAAIGETRKRWPLQSDGYQNLTVLPALGIHSRFQGEPVNDPPKYSHQILGDVIGRAHQMTASELMLQVHRQNDKARALYQRFGFIETGHESNDLLDMVLRLR